MNIALRNICIALLILLTTGSVLFCTFTSTSSMNNGGHDMPLSQDGFTSHFLFAKELTSATTNVHFIFSLVTVFLALVSLIFFYKLYLFLKTKLAEYLKQKYRENLYIIRSTIIFWLSLFELSPNFIKPA